MKNRFLLFVICQCSVAFIYAQETNTKPTKEETINWIANKIYATRTPDYASMAYTNGVISYRFQSTGRYYELNLNALTSIDIGISGLAKGDGITYFSDEKTEKRGDSLFVRRLVLKGAGLVKDFGNDLVNRQFTFQSSVNLLAAKAYSAGDAKSIADIFVVDGLYERMIKALKVLIEYNTAKAKHEKF